MVSLRDTDFLILGGFDAAGKPMSQVTQHNTANQSTDEISNPTVIVENNAPGHGKFCCIGNQVAKVAEGHVVLLGGEVICEFRESTGKLKKIKNLATGEVF